MAWLKRNLTLVIGGVVALALMGLAGWYLYSKWQLNNEILTKLNEAYGTLDGLNKKEPHPGSGQVDNIKIAKEQQEELKQFIVKAGTYFQRIPPIPDAPKLKDQDFSVALSITIDQMQRDATKASVNLAPQYFFSFSAQKSRVQFAQGSLEPLAVQLGEVKAICDILFAARINSLDSLRRERVSSDDTSGPLTDYLDQKSVTNELAVLTPYELTFRCFSPELATVLAGIGNSHFGLLVKSINVELAAAVTPGPEAQPVATAAPVPVPVAPPQTAESAEAAFAKRYGIGSSRGAPPSGLTPGSTPTPVATAAATQPAAAPRGLPVVLDEKQLKVTLMLEIVKLLPTK